MVVLSHSSKRLREIDNTWPPTTGASDARRLLCSYVPILRRPPPDAGGVPATRQTTFAGGWGGILVT